jgi:hypothetical protein
MALTANQKIRVRRAFHRAYSLHQIPTPWTKPEVDAAITAIDDWLDTNAAAYNSALPLPFRSLATAADKSVGLVGLTIAQRLVSDPEHIGVLRAMLAELDEIQGA